MSLFLKLALVYTLLAVGDWYFTGRLCVARASSDGQMVSVVSQ